IKADEPLFDIETDKVSTEIPAPATGVVSEILVAEGTTVKVGTRLAVIRESDASTEAVKSLSASAPAGATPVIHARSGPRADASARLSPVVRRLIAEHRLDPGSLRGTGENGRITREDVLAFLESMVHPCVRTQEQVPYTVSVVSRKPLNPVRKRTAEHMLKS